MLYLYVDKKGGVIRWPATGREDNLCCATFHDNAVWKKEGIELNASRCPHTDTSRSLYVPLSKNNSVVFPIVRTVICISIYAIKAICYQSRFIPVVWWLIVWIVRCIKAVLFLLCDDWSCGQWDVSKPIFSFYWSRWYRPLVKWMSPLSVGQTKGLNKLTMSTDESIEPWHGHDLSGVISEMCLSSQFS